MISRNEIQRELRTLAQLVKSHDLTEEELIERLMLLATACGLPAYVQHQGTNPLKRINRFSKL